MMMMFHFHMHHGLFKPNWRSQEPGKMYVFQLGLRKVFIKNGYMRWKTTRYGNLFNWKGGRLVEIRTHQFVCPRHQIQPSVLTPFF